jgi:hypothetical protein
MANDLTGDYDVTVQFSLGAVNRLTAALHSVKRFPHSVSMAIDDRPKPSLPAVAVGVVDPRGEAVVNPAVIGNSALAALSTRTLLNQGLLDNVDPVVNAYPGLKPIPSEPQYSYVYGVAQAQLGPPTVQLTKGPSNQAQVHTPAMVRYFANTSDPKTDTLSPFMRGELVTTFTVKNVTSKAGADVVVDLSSSSGGISFDPEWSQVTLDANDKKAINLALSKVLKKAFQQSSTPLPNKVLAMDFKGFPGDNAIGVLMNMTTHNKPNPDSAKKVFLKSDDQFVLAVNGDVFISQVTSAINSALDPLRYETLDLFGTVTVYFLGIEVAQYNFEIMIYVSVGTPEVQLTDTPNPAGISGSGQIVLTLPVTVTFGWKNLPSLAPTPVNFGFTITQAFTLALSKGTTQVGIQTVGGVQINIPASVPSDEASQAYRQATSLFDNLWNNNKAQISQQVNNALSASGMESFLHNLLNPRGKTGATLDATLAYTSFEINTSGIVLHGSLSVPKWPAANLQFSADPSEPSGKHGYQALNSWIPGGTIQHYQWTVGTAKPVTDDNRFVIENTPAIIFRICLSFKGQRISASGPVVYDSVRADSSCQYPFTVSAHLPPGAAAVPLASLVQPAASPSSGLGVIGNISPWTPPQLEATAANVLVHFPDNTSVAQLGDLPGALAQSGRTDTDAAIVAVLTQDQLAIASLVDGLMYADDAAGWEQLLSVQSRPATVLLNPDGNIAWRQDGTLDPGALAAALSANLATGAHLYPRFPWSPLRAGDRPPNFLFQFPPGQQLDLRKLAGKPVALVFFKSASPSSVETIQTLHQLFGRPGITPSVIVAIDDGDDGQFARGLSAGEEGGIIVVPDPQRQISLAYRIAVWPTIIFLDTNGLVRDIRFGLISQKDVQFSTGSMPLPAGAAGKES